MRVDFCIVGRVQSDVIKLWVKSMPAERILTLRFIYARPLTQNPVVHFRRSIMVTDKFSIADPGLSWVVRNLSQTHSESKIPYHASDVCRLLSNDPLTTLFFIFIIFPPPKLTDRNPAGLTRHGVQIPRLLLCLNWLVSLAIHSMSHS